MRSIWRGLIAGTLAMALLTACTSGPARSPSSATGSNGEPVLDASAIEASIETLGSAAGKDLAPNRLASGLLPPTNRWFSGLVFGETAQPVFPMPLSFGVTATGFGFGVPDVQTTAKTIMGSYRPSIQVGVPGLSSWQVTAYDELSVTVTARSGTSALGSVTIAEGSPLVTYTATSAQSVSTASAATLIDGVWITQVNGRSYAAVVDKGTISATRIELQQGGRVTWIALPDGGKASELVKVAAPVTDTSAAYVVTDKATTTLHYGTSGGSPTLFAALPHQAANLAQTTCDLGTYPSIYGTMRLCSGTDLRWTSALWSARTSLDLSGLTDAEKQELSKTLATDISTAKPYPSDTYYGGKALYRDAQLYEIATQIGAKDSAAKLKAKVTNALTQWTDQSGCAAASEKCFFYDSTNKGIVGNAPSFGSDEFNDHHFHYGYFLYAAGVMAADDAALTKKIRPVMDLLAADIASSPATAQFVQRRTFDPYASHSWASGTAPFADGNNQESASEAVNAWSGLTLWARASGNTPLEVEATWMHALEAQSANAYWTNFDTTEAVYQGFQHTVTPLVFGGKRDYATWFSPEPAAALAILVLPLSPSSDYLATDRARIGVNVKEAVGTKGFSQLYGDYLLMYSAMQGEQQRTAAIEAARALPADFIDDGNSRTYMMAWLFSLKS